MSDNRREPRQRTFLKGRIIFNNGASSMDCLVRDMSATGARLALSETATLPEVFELFIPQKERTYKASLRWRRTDGIGIAFVDDAAPAAEPPAAATPQADSTGMLALVRRISELEAENAALRRLIAATPAAINVA
ncbi:PilZ domain-containing protein [Methylobacterium sp. 77]|uniref:PilZ domain-containing protein n=1 Tax=Methylobacterium sp. 77 TaxID=1101192 RepID=UPI0003799C45|nr:PilZ domain-containing protein [Methylobacterium sp. 77]